MRALLPIYMAGNLPALSRERRACSLNSPVLAISLMVSILGFLLNILFCLLSFLGIKSAMLGSVHPKHSAVWGDVFHTVFVCHVQSFFFELAVLPLSDSVLHATSYDIYISFGIKVDIHCWETTKPALTYFVLKTKCHI